MVSELLSGVLFPLFVSFFIVVLLGPVTIPFLLKLKVGQTVREEGPETHHKKNGTPTMGGILILLGFAVPSLFLSTLHKEILPVVFLTLGFGVIGFMDDFIKVVLKRSMGLRAWQKMLGQLVVCGIFAYWLIRVDSRLLCLGVPFYPESQLDFGVVINIAILFFIILGTVNGTNFTDGVDGLASSVTAAVALLLALASTLRSAEVWPAGFAMFGALLGFLVFNVHPAKVFMGDTGSLALGGFVAGMAYMTRLQLFIPIFGIIYLVEVLSVIMQVSYFKMTHGKRIFRMAPIHHHFEIGGWSETKVVAVFTIVTILASFISICAMVR